jgi:hypothetical protein
MALFDGFCIFKVGNGAGHFQHASAQAGTQLLGFQDLLEVVEGFRGGLAGF